MEVLASFGGRYIKGVGGFLFTTLVHWFVTIKNGLTIVIRLCYEGWCLIFWCLLSQWFIVVAKKEYNFMFVIIFGHMFFFSYCDFLEMLVS